MSNDKTTLLERARIFLGMNSAAGEQEVIDRMDDEMKSEAGTKSETIPKDTDTEVKSQEATQPETKADELGDLRTDLAELRSDYTKLAARMDAFEALDAAEETQGKKEAPNKKKSYMKRAIYDQL